MGVTLSMSEQAPPVRYVCSAVAEMTIIDGDAGLPARVAVVQDTIRERHFLMSPQPVAVGAQVELTMGTGHHLRATVRRCAHHGWGIFRVRVHFDGAGVA